MTRTKGPVSSSIPTYSSPAPPVREEPPSGTTPSIVTALRSSRLANDSSATAHSTARDHTAHGRRARIIDAADARASSHANVKTSAKAFDTASPSKRACRTARRPNCLGPCSSNVTANRLAPRPTQPAWHASTRTARNPSLSSGSTAPPVKTSTTTPRLCIRSRVRSTATAGSRTSWNRDGARCPASRRSSRTISARSSSSARPRHTVR